MSGMEITAVAERVAVSMVVAVMVKVEMMVTEASASATTAGAAGAVVEVGVVLRAAVAGAEVHLQAALEDMKVVVTMATGMRGALKAAAAAAAMEEA